MDDEQNNALDQSLNQNLVHLYLSKNADELHTITETISEFLNQLEDVKDTLRQQPSRSIADVCEEVPIESSLLSIIPREIKCENYIPLITKLIEIQTLLQEEYAMKMLDQSLDENLVQPSLLKNPEELQSIIRKISELLNQLEDIEDTLRQQPSRSLADVGEEVSVESPILSMIPNEIRCENYMPLVTKLVKIQSQLQKECDMKMLDQSLKPLIQQYLSNNHEELHAIIRTINAFLNELEDIKDTLLQHPSRSLVDVCQETPIESSIVSMIPKEFRCENYAPLVNKLIEIQSLLQEQYAMKMLDRSLGQDLVQSYASENAEQLSAIIRTINEFLIKLKSIEDALLQHPSRSLADVCEEVQVENSILSMISKEIECKNYTQVVSKLIEIQSLFQEQYAMKMLDQSLDESLVEPYLSKRAEELNAIIQTITEFLIKLTDMNDILQQEPSRSLVDVCEEVQVESPIVSMIPKNIKCKNCLPLVNKLIEIQSLLCAIKMLDQSLNQHLVEPHLSKKAEELDPIIQTITEFLNELEDIKDTLLPEPSRLLVEVCQEARVESSIVSMIPKEIECKNHTPVVNNLIEIQSLLRAMKMLDQSLNQNLIEPHLSKKTEELYPIVQTITEFLNELEAIKDTLLQHPSRSLSDVCEEAQLESSIVSMIPKEIQCRNYPQLASKLIEMQSLLQEECAMKMLDQSLSQNLVEPHVSENADELHVIIRKISKFLNQLEDIKDILLAQSSRSLADVCEEVPVESSIVSMIPKGIKCDNYMPVVSKFVEIQSLLQRECALKMLDRSLEENLVQPNRSKKPEQLGPIIETISEVLNQLEDIEDTLRQEPCRSLADVCQKVGVESPILSMIPNEIECKNCAALVSKLVQIRRELKERREPDLYRSLFELNIQSVPLTAPSLFEKIREQQKQIEGSLSSVPNLSIFDIIHPDGNRKALKWRTENIYRKLKTTFEEKKYNFEKLVVVDQTQIFVDFSKENTGNSLLRPSSEYHIIPRASLISLILELESEKIEFSVTLECQISSVINRLIIDRRLTIASSDVFLGFFDELGAYIDEDQTMENVYRSSNTNTIRIKIIKYEDNTNHLSEVTLVLAEGARKKLFHPLTKWHQIDLWLKTANAVHDTHSFCDREQRIILNEDQTLSSTSSIIDGVSNEEIMNVVLSFETKQQHLRMLKSCPVADLLCKRHYLQQLNVQIPSSDCVLVRRSVPNDQILTAEELELSIENYSSVDNEEVHFRIAVLIQIHQYDSNQLIQLPISTRNMTIEQLIQKIPNRDEVYQYLASYKSNLILSNDEQLSKLADTKFYLVKEIETCSVAIARSTEDQNERNDAELIHQRYTVFGRIADLYKQNQDIINEQHLLFDEAIVLSPDTPLTCFQQIESPVRFTLYNRDLETNVTIANEAETDFTLNFRCSPSIEIRHLVQITCQLFNVNERFYQLTDSNNTEFDDSMALYEFAESTNEYQFQLVSTADAKCLITYEERTAIIPANRTTAASTVFEEALEKLFIPREHRDMYELQSLDDPENPSEVDLSATIEEIWTDFTTQPAAISFRLTRK